MYEKLQKVEAVMNFKLNMKIPTPIFCYVDPMLRNIPIVQKTVAQSNEKIKTQTQKSRIHPISTIRSPDYSDSNLEPFLFHTGSFFANMKYSSKIGCLHQRCIYRLHHNLNLKWETFCYKQNWRKTSLVKKVTTNLMEHFLKFLLIRLCLNLMKISLIFSLTRNKIDLLLRTNR